MKFQVESIDTKVLFICVYYSVMFERLSKDGRLFESQTKEHIKKYAEAGLRIMVIAYRVLGEEEYKSWEKEFQKAKTSVSADRDILVDALAVKIERDLILLGATAIEDKLQKGVSVENLNFH
jgi:phospholipid-translocating ATPase